MQDAFGEAGEVFYLPEKFDSFLEEHAPYRRAARAALDDLRRLWGGESEKRRIYEALWLAPLLEREGIKHVHVHFAGIAARTAYWLRRLAGIGYSVTAHANDIFRDEPPERLAQIFDAARVVVTVSDFSVQLLRRQYPALESRFQLAYNGIDSAAFAISDASHIPPLIVSIGRLIEKKGFEVLIKACARVEQDFRCEIIGHGPLDMALQQQIDALGLAGKVVLMGPRGEAEIKERLRQAALFVLPCVTASDGAMDNLPTVIMEAMAAALPVVSTPVAGIPEMVAHGVTGVLVSERSADELADAMSSLLASSEERRRMGAAGLERCRRMFELSVTVPHLRRVLEEYGAFSSHAAS